jgi:RNA polymerase sigma-70 factor (sigma-E family)
MRRAEEQEYREFVVARMEPLRRTAFLLCRDWHTADDLVSITVGKLYQKWRRVREAENPEAYARGVLVNAWLDELRRPWRREFPTAVLPDRPAEAPTGVADRLLLLDLLAQIPPRRRAVVVLRFYCDLPVETVADILRITTGAVKSQASRGLATLRLLVEEGTR